MNLEQYGQQVGATLVNTPGLAQVRLAAARMGRTLQLQAARNRQHAMVMVTNTRLGAQVTVLGKARGDGTGLAQAELARVKEAIRADIVKALTP